jgi:hypothetical protein
MAVGGNDEALNGFVTQVVPDGDAMRDSDEVPQLRRVEVDWNLECPRWEFTEFSDCLFKRRVDSDVMHLLFLSRDLPGALV